VPEPLQPVRIFRALARQHVEYVLVGGLAAVLHGAPVVTQDADICPRRTPQNLTRLAAAMRAMGARIRAHNEPNGVAFTCDADFLARVKMVNLTTRFGDFDIAFEPAAFRSGYEELAAHAATFTIEDIDVKVASLSDIIASKETANRAKDHAALPLLYALEDEIAAQEARGNAGR
jgi:hypothetical protein